MASPQLKNGHLRIAHEVWEHLMCGGLSGSEHDLVMAVIRQTWGWNRKEAEISLAEFGALTSLPESTAARVLNTLVSKKVLSHTKGGGRGLRSKWSFNKDWEAWDTLSIVREFKNQNSLKNESQTLSLMGEFTLKNERVSGCNSLPGLEQQSPKEIFKESKANQESSTPARRDEAYDLFVSTFEKKFETPYLKSEGDFKQLAALRKSFKITSKETPPGLQDACNNYLQSPMESYSIKYMVTGNRYAVLRKTKLDRFCKPDSRQSSNSTTSGKSSEETIRQSVHQGGQSLTTGAK